MIRGTLWYVYPKLATVIENIANRMQYSDRLLVVQNFPPLHNSFIGKEYCLIISHYLSTFQGILLLIGIFGMKTE